VNSNLDFMVSTEGLNEKGKVIDEAAKTIREALIDINNARSSLDGWISQNKDRYDNKIAMALPKLNEMVDVIEIFSKIAMQTSQRAENIENRITAAIENGDIKA